MSQRIATGRRAFLGALVLAPLVVRRSVAQEVPGATMTGDGYRPVRLPARSGASGRLTNAQRDDLEHKLSCPCPCTLDVFTCRTSMSCGFSPRLHADVVHLVDGGYSADEILRAFVNVYGEEALMAPTTQGFNVVGWLAPSVAMATGAAVLAVLIRKWGRRTQPAAFPVVPHVSGTPDELARLDAAVRNESQDAARKS